MEQQIVWHLNYHHKIPPIGSLHHEYLISLISKSFSVELHHHKRKIFWDTDAGRTYVSSTDRYNWILCGKGNIHTVFLNWQFHVHLPIEQFSDLNHSLLHWILPYYSISSDIFCICSNCFFLLSVIVIRKENHLFFYFFRNSFKFEIFFIKFFQHLCNVTLVMLKKTNKNNTYLKFHELFDMFHSFLFRAVSINTV